MNRKSKHNPNTTTLVLHLKKNDEPTGTPYEYNCPFSPNLDPLPPISTPTSTPTVNGFSSSPPSYTSSPPDRVDFRTDYSPPPTNSSPLRIGDRVVWLSDSGPEYGTVRWLGVLPGASPHTMAGVEFVS
jgi:hypothetical protein